MENEILDLDPEQFPNVGRRRDLLPIWIKVFVWMFMLFGLAGPLGIVGALLGFRFNLSLFGLGTGQPLSIIGLSVMLLFFLKGMVSLGLWTEQRWAVRLGQIDAVLSIIVCFFVMAYPFIDNGSGVRFNIRLELILLFPYLLKLNKIRTDWERDPQDVGRPEAEVI